MQLALKIGTEIITDTFLVDTGSQISLLRRERPNKGKTINIEGLGGKIIQGISTETEVLMYEDILLWVHCS